MCSVAGATLLGCGLSVEVPVPAVVISTVMCPCRTKATQSQVKPIVAEEDYNCSPMVISAVSSLEIACRNSLQPGSRSCYKRLILSQSPSYIVYLLWRSLACGPSRHWIGANLSFAPVPGFPHITPLNMTTRLTSCTQVADFSHCIYFWRRPVYILVDLSRQCLCQMLTVINVQGYLLASNHISSLLVQAIAYFQWISYLSLHY